MRHFLLVALAVSLLPCGVLHRPAVGVLVATPGTVEGLLAGALATTLEAVDVAPIAARADADLPLAPLAVVQPVSRFHAPPPPEDTGQWGRSGASCEQSESLLPQRPRRRPGGTNPWAFVLLGGREVLAEKLGRSSGAATCRDLGLLNRPHGW